MSCARHTAQVTRRPPLSAVAPWCQNICRGDAHVFAQPFCSSQHRPHTALAWLPGAVFPVLLFAPLVLPMPGTPPRDQRGTSHPLLHRSRLCLRKHCLHLRVPHATHHHPPFTQHLDGPSPVYVLSPGQPPAYHTTSIITSHTIIPSRQIPLPNPLSRLPTPPRLATRHAECEAVGGSTGWEWLGHAML
jgi:hypothetical protein